MTVHFIGAGPGAADLITIRGRDLIASCPVCLYAGSLVPEELLSHCPADARIVNTAPLDLDSIIQEIQSAHAAGHDIARLHSGDLSVWSAMGEQLRRLPLTWGAYMMLAVKRVHNVRPLRSRWRAPAKVAGRLVEPSTRNPV